MFIYSTQLFCCIQHEFDISQNNDTITEKIVRINGTTIVIE